MTTLCEKCFPNSKLYEIKTIIPIRSCEECGNYDDRKNGGIPCHVFIGDPRKRSVADLERIFAKFGPKHS